MDYIEKIPDISKTTSKKEELKLELRIIDTDFESLEKEQNVKKVTPVKKRALINRLNYKNFQNELLDIHFSQKKDKQIVSISAMPQPCFGKRLVCLWIENPDIEKLLTFYQFHNITFIDGQNLVTINGTLIKANSKGVCITLPDTAFEFSSRKARRFTCEKLDAKLIQNGIVFKGSLIDFSPMSFRVEVVSTINEPLQWINSNDLINLVISSEKENLYSGECKIIKQDGGLKRKNIILQPLKDSIQRFSPKTYRSNRFKLSPSPDIHFNHPITNSHVNLKVIDISGSGISVEDDEENSVLLPGMIIPNLRLNFANSFWFNCKAQVVYRKKFNIDDNKHIVKCGIAFLDMNPNDHMRLLSLLHQADNKNLYICNDIDMDELWNFFFKSGFIYPKKYAFFCENKEKVKKTFKKLYTSDSSIARHFTWQKKGTILGHLSMLRFYETSWLIHHLAALKSEQQLKIGIEMLKQIGSYTYDSHRLFSNHMSYLMCYFRPDNRFPNHFFGGVARNVNNSKACSLDIFTYIHYNSRRSLQTHLNDSWNLLKTTYDDLIEFESFYENVSKGLMIKAFDLCPEPEMIERNELSNEYKQNNLKRKRLLFSLKQNGSLKVLFQINISDVSLNLSDLTNCITVFVIAAENLTSDILLSAIAELSNEYDLNKIPLLIFPHSYSESLSIPYEKLYNLWILDTQFSDDYFKHLDNLF
jgi:hypothetical protein